MISRIKLNSFKANNGNLVPFYFHKLIKFEAKRLFILSGKKNHIRGNHAHKKCTQIFIPILGKTKLEIIYKNKNKKIVLNSSNPEYVKILPLHWCTVQFLSEKSSLLVLCDKEFSENDYIRNFKEYELYCKNFL